MNSVRGRDRRERSNVWPFNIVKVPIQFVILAGSKKKNVIFVRLTRRAKH